MTQEPNWLQGAVIYQIYPRSFCDTNDDGIGDLPGIISKLDYLNGSADSLGVTAIWLSPIFTSPMADFGYDVANYTDIDPLFGNLADMERLLHEAHKRNIKVLLDFVPNHTSDEHAWFVESKASQAAPKRDWYTWRNPAPDGGPPNNWLSVFGGSAWQLDTTTGQYYLHSFLAKQPDLNWDNPEVRAAMKSAMRFWLDMGVDGFRVDAVDWMSKDAELRDDPIDEFAIDKQPGYDHESLKHLCSRDGPHLFERLNEMAAVLEEYSDRVMVTEAHPETVNKIAGYLQYYQGVNPAISAPFNFEGIYLPWKVNEFRNFIDSFQAQLQSAYIPIYTTGNHDESRVASRIGNAAARTAAMLILTLPGTAFMYYGEELGMENVEIPASKTQDPFAGLGHNRDPERTPMQWDASVHAGFSTNEPWLPIADDYTSSNVATQTSDPLSILNLYKRLIHFRVGSETLRQGAYASLDIQESVFGYTRTSLNETLLILLNFSDREQVVSLPNLPGTIAISTLSVALNQAVQDTYTLKPYEGLLVKVLR